MTDFDSEFELEEKQKDLKDQAYQAADTICAFKSRSWSSTDYISYSVESYTKEVAGISDQVLIYIRRFKDQKLGQFDPTDQKFAMSCGVTRVLQRAAPHFSAASKTLKIADLIRLISRIRNQPGCSDITTRTAQALAALLVQRHKASANGTAVNQKILNRYLSNKSPSVRKTVEESLDELMSKREVEELISQFVEVSLRHAEQVSSVKNNFRKSRVAYIKSIMKSLS